MASIDVDFDVYRELTSRRTSEAISYNDVLRELLGLPPKAFAPDKQETRPTAPPVSGDWKARGGIFAEGTEIRLTHKGVVYQGRVDKGAFVMKGKTFATVEELAGEITQGNPKEWIFWSQRKPGESNWTELKAFRSEMPEE
jgi:hypothetical protein